MDTDSDYGLILFLSSAGPCSLAKTTKKDNWVDRSGHLPNYICHIAKAVMRSGHSTSSAIAIAIGTAKRWAAGGDKVNADTRAKAARAIAQWEALKAKAHAGHLVKASNAHGEDFITLASSDSYNMDAVREAYGRLQTLQQAAKGQQASNGSPVADYDDTRSWSFIREVWSDFIIVEVSGPDDIDNYKVPYTVEDGDEITFGVPVRVKQAWDEQDDDELNDEELQILNAQLALQSPNEEFHLSAPNGPRMVRTLEGQRKYGEPVGHTIVDNAKTGSGTPSTVIRLISLYRHFKQVKASGDSDGAEAALKALNQALDDFPATKDNKDQLAKIRKLVAS